MKKIYQFYLKSLSLFEYRKFTDSISILTAFTIYLFYTMVNNPLSNEKSMYFCRSDHACDRAPASLNKPESSMFRLVQAS